MGCDTITPSMTETDEIRLRLRISKVEAKLALAEIEAEGISRESSDVSGLHKAQPMPPRAVIAH